MLLVLLASSCSYCAFLLQEYWSRNQQLALLRQQLASEGVALAEKAALRNVAAQMDELEDLRRNHLELGGLTARVAALRAAEAQKNVAAQNEAKRLELENQHLRLDLEQAKHSPSTLEARASVDGNQLQQIAAFFQMYARNNSGRYPRDFSELKFYLPANVYPSIETNRFEILVPDAAANSDPSQRALVRTLGSGDQSAHLYLFADGHLETRGGP
jgi:hypothetical protein